MLSQIQIDAALRAIQGSVDSAYENFNYWIYGRLTYSKEEMEFFVEKAFIQLLTLLELLGLSRTYDLLLQRYQEAKQIGFAEIKRDPEDEPYLFWMPVLRTFIDSIPSSGNENSPPAVQKDLSSILKAMLFPITDESLFATRPMSEDDVHTRIEGILRVIFPDLQRKPRINKPIKSFEPDTGLPSIRTLIEYKFVSDEASAKRVAEEILADTRGYISAEWDTFFYVIYETVRVKSPTEWENLLRNSGVVVSTSIVVLHGVEPKPGQSKPAALSQAILNTESSA
ncbi:MAG TPA: hypothetical protein VF746_12430 [Longimicrobium sp.]|jgi:hypothetical protein